MGAPVDGRNGGQLAGRARENGAGDEAAAIWGRMSALGGSPPEFLSTHPSHERQIDDLRKELPAARRIAAQVNRGAALARQFVEKTLSVGGSFFMPDVWVPLIGTAIGGASVLAGESGDALDSTAELFDPGAAVFFDAKYIELNVAILPKHTTRYLFGIDFKRPFPLNPKTTWFPTFGVNYGDYGYGYGPTWGINYGIGLDYDITQRLFFRGTAAMRQWIVTDSDKIRILTFPVKLGVGYAFY